MTITNRPNLTSLPVITSPTVGTTEFIVQVGGVDGLITTPQVLELLNQTPLPQGPTGAQGTQGTQGLQGFQGTQGL